VTGSSLRILIVDDHQLFAEALTTRFALDERFEVVGTAGSGVDAVRVAQDAVADVVLMDMSMPEGDGLRATRRLLALEAPPCVIALSGHTDQLTRSAALEAGVAEFVSKTDAYEDLAETIVAACAARGGAEAP
jgi:DNA-binding NarL/FixJ family response regulator